MINLDFEVRMFDLSSSLEPPNLPSSLISMMAWTIGRINVKIAERQMMIASQ